MKKEMIFFENWTRVKETAEKIICVFLIVLLLVVMQLLGITCPIKFLTGVSCAGCGMTRAWLSVLHLEFKEAFYYHPLFAAVPVAGVVFLLKNRIGEKLYKAFWCVLIAVFLLVYLCRLLSGGNDIVVFEPENSLLCRVIRFLWED